MSNSEKHSELIELAVRKLTGEATSMELENLAALLKENKEYQKLYLEIEKTWKASEEAKGITSSETDEEWARLQEAIHTSDSSQSSFSIYKIAASILIVLGIAVVLFIVSQSDQTELYAVQTTTYTFNDGSQVTLKTNAKLIFKEGFIPEKREVFLEGEAYFDIAKAPNRPFIVHSDIVDVTVLGTSFNVNTDTSSPEVVVVSGIVNVKHDEQNVELEAGDKASLASGQLLASKNNDPNFLSWKTMDFTFSDASLSKVIQDLSDAYQTPIRINENIDQCKITVSFENQSLDEILSVITATLGLSLEQTDQGILLTGQGC